MKRLQPEILACLKRALEEDIGTGDVTTNSIVPADAALRGQIIAKKRGIVTGLDIAEVVLLLLSAEISFRSSTIEGSQVEKG